MVEFFDGECFVVFVKSYGGFMVVLNNVYDLVMQYWMLCGIVVIDVNYCGSIGYGWEYCDKLCGQWGVYDVVDCEVVVCYFVKEGFVDGQWFVICGGSVGGFMMFCVLIFGDVFKVGVSYYGVGDLEMLVCDMYKFELCYFDSIVGLYLQEQEFYCLCLLIYFVD